MRIPVSVCISVLGALVFAGLTFYGMDHPDKVPYWGWFSAISIVGFGVGVIIAVITEDYDAARH